MDAPTLAVQLIVLVAAWTDVRTRTIPNSLTVPAAALGLFASAAGGLGGIVWSVGGWVTGLAVFLPVYLLRGLGAGDVKLLAACGAWLGPVGTLHAAILAAITGGALAIATAVASGALPRVLTNIGTLIQFWAVMGVRPFPALTLEHASGPRLPYAVPIAIGVGVSLWLA